MKKILFILFVFISTWSYAASYTVSSIPNPKTNDANNFVSNPDGIISRQTVARLNEILQSLEADTKAEVAVVLVSSIGNDDIKDFATRLFEKWGVGKAGADNGLLLLFVLDQRAITIETGYGLEGVFPDAIANRVLDENILPEFRKGDYDAGFVSGVERISSILRKEPVAVPEKTPVNYGVILPVVIAAYIILLLIAFFWMNSAARSVKKNSKYPNNIARYKAFKGQKSGINSIMAFILPFVLLLVAIFLLPSGYWVFVLPTPLLAIPANLYGKWQLRKIRRQPIPCGQCGGTMHLLTEKEEDKYLSVAQQFEEQLSAVDYDVFVCDKCDNTVIYTYDKPSQYSVCPNCGTKAFILVSKKVTIPPTYASTGVERLTYKCKYCGYEENKNNKIPRLQRNTGALVGGMAAGSILGGGGGRSGGGFSGGGSFGGGRSGGGGATGRW